MRSLLLWVSAFLPLSLALQGYDCGHGKPNITTISLIEVGGCEVNDLQIISHPVYIQLLQAVEFEQTSVLQCKIFGRKRIRRCGMFSHTADVEGGDSSFIKKISADECHELARFGQFKYGQAIIAGIQVNKTTRQSATVVGSLKDDGYCQGTIYVEQGHEYQNVVVTIDFEVTVQEFSATVRRSGNEIYLPTGTKCHYSTGQCFVNGESYAFWYVRQTPSCNYEAYETLFQGFGARVSENSTRNPDIYFANSTNSIQFGLAKTGEFSLCGYRLVKTEHPKLFIFETTANELLPAKSRLDVQDILLTAYFNTKLTFFSRHIKTQFTNVYRDIVFQRCQIERQVIFNSLSLITSSPDEFALNIMKQPGFTAISAGEAAHIIQCEPSDCKIRITSNCYEELPVLCNGTAAFLRPKTKILTRIGTPRDCSNVLPSLYSINGVWRAVPASFHHHVPHVIQPMKTLTWRYQDVDGLLNDGIYTPQDLERLHEHSVFPMERPALLESIARKLTDKAPRSDSMSMRNLLDREAIAEIAESALDRAWSGFMKFGTAAAGVFAIFMVLQLIKAAFDTLIHGYTLYKIYGWSIHLLGAIWASMTHLLLFLAKTPANNSQNDAESGQRARRTNPSASSPARHSVHYSTMPTAKSRKPVENATNNASDPNQTQKIIKLLDSPNNSNCPP